MRTSQLRVFLTVLAIVLVGGACSVNRSFNIDDGTTRKNGLHTVNGSIRVGTDCRVGGSCETVNGRIKIGNTSQTEDLQTINGRITVGEGCRIDGDLDTVNGSVKSGVNTVVTGEISTVNGDIQLTGTEVGSDLRTVNGDITLEAEAEVGGDIIIHGNSSSSSPITIRISGGSVVKGDVRVKNRRKAVVILESGSEVRGEVTGAEVVEAGEEVI